MNAWMKNPAARVALFVLLVFGVDRAIGASIAQLVPHVTTGESTGLPTAAVQKCDVDVMILGSSRARNNVVANDLAQRIGLTVYNAGADGQGIYYARGLQAVLTDRGCLPDTFALLVDPPDLYHPRRPGGLIPYTATSPTASEFFAQLDPAWRVKSLSRAYLYNSQLLPLLSQFVSPDADPHPSMGWFGLVGDMAGQQPVVTPGFDPILAPDAPIEPRAAAAYGEFVAAARRSGTRVVFFTAPYFRASGRTAQEDAAHAFFAELAAQNDIPVLQLTEREVPQLDGALWRDPDHLNGAGAVPWTAAFAEAWIRARLPVAAP